MKKALIGLVLLIIIIFSFSFVYFKTQAAGPEDNYFNTHLRAKFAAWPEMRQLLALHFDGDARGDYLGRRYKKILIEVDVMDTLEARLDGLNLLAERIQALTGKSTTYVISDRKLLYDRGLTPEHLQELVAKYRNYKNSGNTATIYLLFAGRKAGEPNLLGQTWQEYGLILFEDALQSFTEDSPETLANYEESTALHEFGHQLGLAHNSEPGCLMNERADRGFSKIEKPEDVITDFCSYEITKLYESTK